MQKCRSIQRLQMREVSKALIQRHVTPAPDIWTGRADKKICLGAKQMPDMEDENDFLS